MYFDSTVYAVFLILVVVIYWRLRFRAQNLFLLAASYFFYGWWDWRFLFLMATSTVVDYLVGRGLERTTQESKRRLLLTVSVTLNLCFLGFFKYCNFFISSFSHVAVALGMGSIPPLAWKIILPPAISFYTFQEVAYIVDVYKRKLRPADSLVQYALFVSLFPHLIAGPIQRPSHLLPQTQQPRHWDPAKAFDGILLIVEGLFRKIVIADNCALVANGAFGGSFGGPNLLTVALGTYAFAWQIYGDFSGYSSIARGSAQLLGFHFMVNFRQPYLADSVQEFWRRWHISLSTWLRDYLYIPLGGNRQGALRTYANLMVTMLLGGLWHGANWTFVLWGGIHGAALCGERLVVGRSEVGAARNIATRWLRRLAVFGVVCLAWVFFRAPGLHAALAQLAGLAVWEWRPVYASAIIFLGVYSLLMILIDASLEASGTEYLFANRGNAVRIATALLLAVLMTLMAANQTSDFIYFRF